MSRTKIIDTLTFAGSLIVLSVISLVYLNTNSNPKENEIHLNTRTQSEAKTPVKNKSNFKNLSTCDNLMGLNIDPFNPAGRPPVDELQILGVTWLRIEWRADNGDYTSILNEYHNAGYKIMFLIDNTSMGVESNPDPAEYAAKFEEGVNNWDEYVDAYEIWNEPDLKNEHYVSPSALAEMTKRAKDVLTKHGSKAKIITGGGLASGDVSYLKSLVSSLGNCNCYDAVAVHPYVQAPDGFSASWTVGKLTDFFNKYKAAAGGKPLWITEIGHPDSSTQSNYLYKFYQTTKKSGGADKLFWFAYSDGMVSGFGLKTASGSNKPSYDAYVQAAKDFGGCLISPEPSGEVTPTPNSTPVPSNVCPTDSGDDSTDPNTQNCSPVVITEPANGSTISAEPTFKWCTNPSVDCDGVSAFTLEVYNADDDYSKYDWNYEGEPEEITYSFDDTDMNGEIMTLKLTTIYDDGRSCTKTHTYKKGEGSGSDSGGDTGNGGDTGDDGSGPH